MSNEQLCPSCAGRSDDGLICQRCTAKERHAAKSARWVAANPERVREIQAKSRAKHRDKRIADSRKKYYANLEENRRRAREAYRSRPLEAKAVSAERQRARRFGLDVAGLRALLSWGDGGCWLCGKKEGKIVVDHCHETGQVRGILCNPCNVAIGVLGDTVDGLRMALNYLEASHATEVLAA